MTVNTIIEAEHSKLTVQNQIALNSWTAGQQATHTGLLRLFQTAQFDTKVPVACSCKGQEPMAGLTAARNHNERLLAS